MIFVFVLVKSVHFMGMLVEGGPQLALISVSTVFGGDEFPRVL